MDMYVMIPPSDDGASAGKGFMPFLKIMFDLFSLGGGVFSYRLGHFLREGMKPSPALDVCCIAALSRRRDGVYPRPTNSGQDTKQIPRSSEGGDKPHPYVGCVLLSL